MEAYHTLPLVTKTYATLAFLTTAACSLEIISSHKLYFNTKAIMNGEVWRLLTTFLWFGPLGIDFLFHMFFLVRYSKSLEEGSFRGRSADYLWMLLLGGGLMLVVAPFIDVLFLGASLTFMMVYVWARRNQYVNMSLLGIFTFTAPYLPWVLLAFSLVLGNSPAVDLLGIGAGHLYYFLTPGFIRALFATDDPIVRLAPEAAADDDPPQLLPEDSGSEDLAFPADDGDGGAGANGLRHRGGGAAVAAGDA